MIASLFIIGSEITKGIIGDKHSKMISNELTLLGIKVSRIAFFPDDISIEESIREEKEKSDIIIVTGGLGPTQDDLTRRAISGALNRPLSVDRDAEAWLRAKLKERATGSNLRQAELPEGFFMIDNPNGTAPGFWGEVGRSLIISLPGPPRELEPMLYSSVLPLIREKKGLGEAECDEYSSFLTPEAKLEDLFEEEDSDLSFGTRFQDYKISIYLSGLTKEKREEAIFDIRKKVGDYRIFEKDVEVGKMLFDALKDRKKTIAFAESCTGGLLSSHFASIPGVSEVFMGSVVSYAYSVKEDVLKVSKETIERYGAVSRECAIEMARGVREKLGSDYAASVTGVAGPKSQEGHSVGHVVFGFSGDRGDVAAEVELGTFSRDAIRRRAVVASMLLMCAYINGDDTASIASSWKAL